MEPSSHGALLLKWALYIPLALLATSHLSSAASDPLSSRHLLLNQLAQWRRSRFGPGPETAAAWVLCFLAASVCSAGGVGGGSLFLPILNLVAGLSLKRATTFSAFMVAAGSLSNVLYTLLVMRRGQLSSPLINYEIALLSQPCMLLGVSAGVVCNLMFPEWLITVSFAAFLACCTYKTFGAGLRCWEEETKEIGRVIMSGSSGGAHDHQPLLVDGARQGEEGNGSSGIPLKDLVVLLFIWLCFFLLHALLGDKHGKGVIHIRPCGVAYWLITLSQIPLALVFTAYILYKKKKPQLQNHEHADEKGRKEKASIEALPVFVFPSAALLTGVLSGLFGIGGGLLLNPVLLQIGVPPQTAASTSTFMVLFSASMSMVQYIILGMDGINQALIYAAICLVASVFGLVIMERAIRQSGRVSLIVFLVGGVMALSTLIISSFGAVDVWKEYTSGEYMGFKLLC
ncbi:uncharacterized protein LOC109708596 [Ananas comosus]|uniref:Uncharacterized protein LOC109708596 n=1 Tax=Ananas comosus TaxID=4615 RepID=A0A6P5EQL6_ANACO|nr:uncharacterized protein LOC109708596 [Ananas comosus]